MEDGAVETDNGAPEAAGTIVLLDDEPVIRRVVGRVLERQGYHVLTCGSAAEALALLDATPDVALLLADLTLAGGSSGAEVAAAARVKAPGLKVMFVTGHSAQTVADVTGGGQPLVLQKPFTPARLREAVATVLAGT
jgi:CheY-like chemotaxis protein